MSFSLGTLDGNNGFGIPGIVGGDDHGKGVSVVGDVNGDGFDDLLVGAPFAHPAAGTGEAYIIFGKAGGFSATVDVSALDGTSGFTIRSTISQSNFGGAVGAAGDLNGDGFADIAIGAGGENVGANSGAGAVYIVFGKASFTPIIDAGAINGTDGFKFTGTAAVEFLGSSVGSAGDFNSDGFDDLLITAGGANGGFAGKGAGYVLFGKPGGFAASASIATLDGANGFKMIGEATGDFLGHASSAGDVNGDGFADVILGASRNDANGKDTGTSYVVFGQAGGFAASFSLSTLDGTNGFRLRGALPGDYAGFTVGGGGDVNGDGFADLLVGAVNADPGGDRSGASYVVFGKSGPFAKNLDLSSLNGTTGFRLTGVAGQNFVGYDIENAGDVNGDGFDEVIVAAQTEGAELGGAYIIYGKAGGFAATLPLAQLQDSDGFRLTGTLGSQVSGHGDANGDGLDDLLLGSRDFNAAYVFFGFDSGAVTHRGDASANTLIGDAGANVIVAGQAGDTLLGNGGADVLRGGQGDDVLAIGNIAFKRINGGLGTDTLRLDGAGLVLNLPLISGLKLASIEQIDLTGSGANRLTLSALNTRDVLNLSPTSNTLTVFGDAGDFVDFGAGWIRQANQVIGADTFETFTNGAATLRIANAVGTSLPSGYVLTIVGNELPGLTINGVAAVDTASTVSTAGDVNGDGFDDFLIGAARADPHGDSSGAVYVVFGKAAGFPSPLELSNLDGTNGFTLLGERIIDYTGYSLSGAGDFNGDGFADIIVGSFNASGTARQSGTAYVIFGKSEPFTSVLELSALDGNNGFKLRATPFSVQPGLAVHAAGDVNGDGFDDVVVGAPSVTVGTVTQRGAAYVVFGRAASPGATLDLATLNGTNGFAIAGKAKFELAGVSVSGGDVNADGFSDVIVGTHSGNAYVVFGKASSFAPTVAVAALDGTNGFTIDGVSFQGGAGSTISAAGDVNGDGVGDLLVGAPVLDVFTTKDIGGAFVVYGKPGRGFGKTVKLVTLPAASGFSIIGEKAGDFAGQAVSAAGDVNGDGYDDILIGGTYSAEAYVIYGNGLGRGTLGLAELNGTNGFTLVGPLFTRGSNGLSAAGDVNGDGFDDLLVGTFGAPGGRVGAGISYLVFGFNSGAVTHLGGSANDMLTATAGADVIVTGQGNDTVLGVGSNDVVRGGQGDDVFTISAAGTKRFVGGNGVDTLMLAPGAGISFTLDLTSPSTRFSGFEQVNLGLGNNTLKLDARAVANLSPTSNTLTVRTDGDDFLSIGPGWISQGNEVIGGESFNVFKQGGLTLKVQENSVAVTLMNATTAAFTDVDGDLVKIKVSKGILSFADFKLAPAGTVGGFQLQLVNLSDDGGEFKDANLTITAARTALGGDGRVNVGYINATSVDLGTVTVEGDLGSITAGDATVVTPGIDTLTVRSMGSFGVSTQGPGGFNYSSVIGKLSTLNIASDLTSQILANAGLGGVAFGTVKIGGSILPSALATGLVAIGSIGSVNVGKDIRGGLDTFSGSVSATDNIGPVTIGGSLIGGTGFASGTVAANGTLGALKVGGDVDRGRVWGVGSIASIAVSGSVLSAEFLSGYNTGRVAVNADATIGTVTVDGDWVASNLVAGALTTDSYFGNGGDRVVSSGTTKVAKITSIAIKGQAIGTPGGADHFGFVAEEIGSFTVGGTTRFPLTDGPANDLSGFYVGLTLDMKVREVNGIAPAIDPPIGGGGGGGGGTSFGFPLASLDGTNGFEFSGAQAASDTGRTVNAAGDVNNDGFDDFIVGALGASPAGRQFAGEAYVVFGKGSGFPATFDANALDGTNGFRIQGNVADEHLGVGASGVGDFNNDGFDDVIVGAINLQGLSGSDTSGYVIFGKASFATTPTINVGALNGSNGVELRAPHDSDTGAGYRMGVSGAGDINNDGFDDAIVGVFNADNSGVASGAVFIVFGRANSAAALIDAGALNGANGFRFDSGATGVHLGSAVSEAGDINGDGIDDIVLGAHNENPVTDVGAAYVIFGRTSAFPATLGRSDLNGATGFRIFGEMNYGAFGYSVDSAGDVNGDGFSDLVVGAPYASINGEFSGATYVIYGKQTSVSGPFQADLGVATLNGTNGFRIVGESEYDYAGRVGGVGDVNGDGFDDIGIGAFGAGTPTKTIGNGYVVFGRPTSQASFDLNALTVRSGIRFLGVADNDQTGISIAGAGDVNNDGLDDLLIGAFAANATAPGAAYLVFGVAGKTHAPIVSPLNLGSLNGTTGFQLPGEAIGDQAGRAVHAAGDVNGDGIDDLLLGAIGVDAGAAATAGAAYVVFGTTAGFSASFAPSSLDGTNGFTIEGMTAGEAVGHSLGSADVNGDGFSDVIVGTSNSGAYVVFGKASGFTATMSVSALTGANGFKITGPAFGAIGFAVSGAGDVNGDGFDEVIIGDYRDDSIKGAAYVIFGKGDAFSATLDVASLNGTSGFKLTGATTGDRAGTGVSDAGDVNGDGIDDLMVGAPESDPHGEASGTAYVVYGKTSAFPATMSLGSLSGANGFALNGVQTIDLTGYSVSGAGDVNGDGFADIIVGQREDLGGTSGHAYVVFGRATNANPVFELSALNGTNGFRLDGTGSNAHAGISVSDAGDVNGDGFADVIVGAYGYNNYAGAAYLVYGKAGAFGATLSLSVLSGTGGVKLLAAGSSDNAGHSVSNAGDINGDGFADVIVGAFLAKPNGNLTGAGYVVFGGGIGASGSGAGVSGGGGPVTPPPGPLTISADQKSAMFTDVDGDQVTVKTSVGMFVPSDFTRVGVAGIAGVDGSQLQKLKLNSGFAGANITITAIRGPLGGDGFVNVGFLDARNIDLGTVTIEGDLGQIDAGNGDPARSALTSLTVQSLGRLGLSTQAAAGASLESNVAGRLGKLTVRSDVVGAFVNVAGSVDNEVDDTGAISIGGTLRGETAANSGTIFAGDDIASVKIGQGIIGGAGAHSGSIESGGKIGVVALGNSLLGGSGTMSGSIISAGTLGASTIAGDLTGRIVAKGNLLPKNNALALAIKDLMVTGSVRNADILAGYDRSGALVNANAQIGDVVVNHDWIASDLVAGVRTGPDGFFGNGDEVVPGGNSIISKIASILIKGQVLGTVGGADHFGFVAQQIGSFTIGSDSFNLVPGPSNDSAGIPIGATFDLRVREQS
jgi:hypothetical protein